MSLLAAGIMAGGALAGAIGKRRGRRSSERAAKQQMKFLKEDAAAVRAQYADQAEQTRNQGEKVIGNATAMAGKFGNVGQGMSDSTTMVQDESRANLEQDVQNIIKQGDIEANRILNQRDQINSQYKNSRRTGWLSDVANLSGVAAGGMGGYTAFGGDASEFGSDLMGFLNPFKKRS